MKNTLVINDSNIQDKIYTIRGVQVMLDRDLAEFANLRSKNLTSKNHRDKYNPKLFTEQGVSIFKYNFFNTPFPPLYEVPKKGSSL